MEVCGQSQASESCIPSTLPPASFTGYKRWNSLLLAMSLESKEEVTALGNTASQKQVLPHCKWARQIKGLVCGSSSEVNTA